MFTIAEELVLLSFLSGRDWLHRWGFPQAAFGLAGGVIAELLQCKRPSVHGPRIERHSGLPTGHRLLDRVTDAPCGATAQSCVEAVVSGQPDITRTTLDRLAARGILRCERRHILGLVPYERYVIVDARPARQTLSDVRSMALTLPIRMNGRSLWSACPMPQTLWSRSCRRICVRMRCARILIEASAQTSAVAGAVIAASTDSALATATVVIRPD